MTNRLEQQAAQECANYDGGMCLPCDKPCKLKQGNKICGYFEKTVQPLDPVLKALYEREELSTLKPCPRCGRLFTPTGRRQTYCQECGARLQRERAAERVRRYRERR